MRTALLLSISGATALPRWSWDTVQTYVHCANRTGALWSSEAVKVLALQNFVVLRRITASGTRR